MRPRLRRRYLLGVLPALVVVACTLDPLNPQPLPPDPPPEFGPGDSGSSYNAADARSQTTPSDTPDGGLSANADAGNKGDAAPAPPESDAGDAGDAASDAASDADAL